MFGTLGGPEVVLILVIALIVFGPRRLPEIGKSMGKMLAEFRKASNDFKRTIEDELEAEKAKESEPPRLTAPEPPASSVATATPESTAVPPPSTTPDALSAPPAIEYAAPPWTPAIAPAEAPPPPVVAPEDVIVSREPPAEKK
jgi:TatA/E family protein of Tat protein translocase